MYRARHKIDGQLYAVKRVVLPSKQHAAIAEAESMAKLSNHPNVVRYYASWVETANPGLDSQSDDDSEEEDSDADGYSDDEESDSENSSVHSDESSALSLYIQMELCEEMSMREYLQ